MIPSSRLVMALSWGWGCALTVNGQAEGIVWNDGTVLELDCGKHAI